MKIAVATVAALSVAAASPVELDPTWGGDGVVRTLLAHGEQSGARADQFVFDHGRVVVAGGASGVTSGTNTATLAPAIVRYLPDGRLDRGFGHGGVAGARGFGEVDSWTAAVALPGGKLAVAAQVFVDGPTPWRVEVARLTRSGAPDRSFGRRGFVRVQMGTDCEQPPVGLVAEPDGALVVGVNGCLRGPEDGVYGLFKLRADGRLDRRFGTGGRVLTRVAGGGLTYPSALVRQPDGKLVLVGRAFVDRAIDIAAARYTRAGRLDASFGEQGIAVVHAPDDVVGARAFVRPGGRLLVAAVTDAGFALLRLGADGSLDETFGRDGVVDHGRALGGSPGVADAPDGALIVWGRGGLRRLRPDGSVDTAFGPIPVGVREPGALAVDPAGRILAAGTVSFGFAKRGIEIRRFR